MQKLTELLETCEKDTKRILNAGAANRLAAWRRYQTQEEVVAFIAKTIKIRDNQANGFIIHAQKGVSLESIVAIHLSTLFSREDVLVAKKSLGLI